MGRKIFYGSFAVIIAIGSWFYIQGEKAPDSLLPAIVLLFAIMSYGYAEKAKEDGDFGAGSGKIYRDKNPKIFRITLYLNYMATVGLLVWTIWLFVK